MLLVKNKLNSINDMKKKIILMSFVLFGFGHFAWHTAHAGFLDTIKSLFGSSAQNQRPTSNEQPVNSEDQVQDKTQIKTVQDAWKSLGRDHMEDYDNYETKNETHDPQYAEPRRKAESLLAKYGAMFGDRFHANATRNILKEMTDDINREVDNIPVDSLDKEEFDKQKARLETLLNAFANARSAEKTNKLNDIISFLTPPEQGNTENNFSEEYFFSFLPSNQPLSQQIYSNLPNQIISYVEEAKNAITARDAIASHIDKFHHDIGEAWKRQNDVSQIHSTLENLDENRYGKHFEMKDAQGNAIEHPGWKP
jgi:hypothetical protein